MAFCKECKKQIDFNDNKVIYINRNVKKAFCYDCLNKKLKERLNKNGFD